MTLEQAVAKQEYQTADEPAEDEHGTLRVVITPNRAHEAALRALDIFVSGLALLILLPLFAVIAIAIRLDSAGSVLFVQKRVGREGREFDCFKFRSMRPTAETIRFALEGKNERTGPVFKMRDDPRITRVGRLLRRSSLDELPQLINVFRGDMSLVGPRPALPSEVAQYTPRHRQRLLITPGLTGLWQVSGRANLPFEAMIDLDLRYIQDRSLWLNIRILALTVPAVMTARGAY
jgi:lipopolysaccharide/colanic/teichoic acid biosynthesis glycosyltransferase